MIEIESLYRLGCLRRPRAIQEYIKEMIVKIQKDRKRKGWQYEI